MEKAHETHPDHEGNPEDFKMAKEAFDHLSHFCREYQEQQTEKTLEGQNIFDLGKGLGPLINAKKCEDCQGQGYQTANREVIVSFDICPICEGKGKTKVCDNYKRKMITLTCIFCWGTGKSNIKRRTQKQRFTCEECKGSGEIEIFNPVLTKGMLRQKRKTERTNKKEYCSCGALMKNGKCWRCN